MNEGNTTQYLFEVSWEICNKVGGINTVVKTKAPHAVERFGDNYVLIGPDVGNNPEFEETEEDIWFEVKRNMRMRNLTCLCGRWNTEGRPRVVLVNHNNKYRVDELLFQLWQDFGVDSMEGEWDYIEPALFGSAAGETIHILHSLMVGDNENAVAQFHEWMSAAGMLYVKKQIPKIATVLTTHATMLGRSLAGSAHDIYSNIEGIAPKEAAARMRITAKHSMETVAARETDCLTTVSEITAREVSHFLQRSPDVILPNGINIHDIPECLDLNSLYKERRDLLLDFASKFLQEKLVPEKTKIVLVSGRYEFHNKGIDVFLEALHKLKEILKERFPNHRIVSILSVIGGHVGVSDEAQQIFKGMEPQRSGVARISTHRLQNPQHDPIWNTCSRLNLLNAPDDPVKVIFMPVYLDGYDGLLNLSYYDVLCGCDLGVFPSYYEPWGYTPLECVAYCVPAVTTDLAGFGLWVKNHFENGNRGVILLNYDGRILKDVVDELKDHMVSFLDWSSEERNSQIAEARSAAEKTTWKAFYPFYLQAYEKALKSARDRIHALDTSAYRREICYVGTDSLSPRFKNFSVIAPLPKSIEKLREIAYNLRWTWDPEIRKLFVQLDPNTWKSTFYNPIEMLERIDHRRLEEAASEDSYLELYNRAVESLEGDPGEKNFFSKKTNPISGKAPIAYFSTEYGLHSSLPIYSGGLGVLSADHLKSASDLNIPIVGVGLLYKNGYFVQRIDSEGNQKTIYLDNDFSRMPVRMYDDGTGEPVKILVELPGRKLYAQVWKVDVGRVALYLLDTSIPENNVQDMKITGRLYAGDQKLRIEQEIMLGIGGVRLLEDLGIVPSLFHLNEGHSAFLLVERIRQLVKWGGLSFYEAREVVKSNSVFTTHSPVEAANERFEESLMRSYFSEYVKDLGISWETFWELGREEPGTGKPFFMPVLAFKLTSASNAVSKLHGTVARKMWRNVWSGYDENETPIIDITNGVHMQTWTAAEMRDLYENYLGINFYSSDFDRQDWEKIETVPDNELWQTHVDLKGKMIQLIKKRVCDDCDRQGISPALKNQKVAALDPNALIIGFARRFVEYKRAGLIFQDTERLYSIMKNADLPVQIIFAGKAHPNDETGRTLVKRIFQYAFEEKFINKIFFLQNYNLEVARYMVSGVDLWLNTPRRLKEACGTSGMKTAMNGGLNLSTLDGWWDEAFNTDRGWAIGGRSEYANTETQDLSDSENLYQILENMIIPAFSNRNAEGIPEKWVSMMKKSIGAYVPLFNSHRMLREYSEKMYLPVAERAAKLKEKGYLRAKALTEWKMNVASRFSTDHIRWYKVKGFPGDRLELGNDFEIEVGVELGKLTQDEMRIELVIVESMESGQNIKPIVIRLEKAEDTPEETVKIYRGTYKAERSGRFMYGVRVTPCHPDLYLYQEMGLVHWA